MTKRRRLLAAIASAPLLYSHRAGAQDPAKRPCIGYLASNESGAFYRGLRDELQRLGYIDGKTVVFNYRTAEGRIDRIPGLVQELVGSKLDVLVLTNNVAIRTAQRATATIPIVIVTAVDPIAAGYAKSLRRPGGNITGISTLQTDLSAKRMELLKELVPGIVRLAVLWDTDGPGPRQRFQEYLAAANTLKLDVQSLPVKGPVPDLESVFRAAKLNRSQALVVIANPLVLRHQKEVMAFAARHALPSIGEFHSHIEAGGLMYYGPDMDEQAKMLANIVARVLKGAKPAELPIEQPSRIELVVNLRTAKELAITIPQTIMARADRVIQ